MEIETERLLLRPVDSNDVDEIARVVFGDPAVVGMLAHNTKDPADARTEAERWVGGMGRESKMWLEGGIGLFAVIPKLGGGALAGVCGFYMKQNESHRWKGEYFYALGSSWHGKGLMSEATDAVREKLRLLPNLEVIYGVYWDMINEASGRILVRAGLRPTGRTLITKEYSPEKCRRMFDYDLWRLGNAQVGPTRKTTLVQAARRAGGFVAEDVVTEADALARLADAYGARLTGEATKMFDTARTTPGMAYLELKGGGESGSSDGAVA